MGVASVILNYNDYKTTISLLNRIKNYKSIDKIVVVDNNSNDNSYEILLNYSNEKIDVIKSKKNGGYGYGNNYGVEYLKSKYMNKYKYILISNPDTIFSEQVIFSLINAFKESNVALVAPLTLKPNLEKQLPIAWKVPHYKDFFIFSSFILNRILNPMSYDNSYFEKKNECIVECVQGSLFMIDIEQLPDFILYDENIFLYFEESTLGIRLKKRNLKSKLLLNVDYIHEHSVSINKSITSEYAKRKLMLESFQTVIFDEYKPNCIMKSVLMVWKKICLVENYILLRFFSKYIRK